MKRLLVLVTLGLIMVLLLVACGGTAQPTTEPAEEPVTEPTEAPMEEPTEAPMAEEPTEEPMEEPTEEPMEEPTEAPTEEAAAEEPTEAPTAEAGGDEAMAEGEIQTVFTDCAASAEGETITIYQQAGLTGPLATILGDGFINGSRDAVDAINEAGGVCGATLEIRLEDSQYDPEQEVAIYEQFRAEDPPPYFVLTYGSGATIALKDRVNEDQIPNIAAGLNAEAFYIPRNGYTVGAAPIYSDQFAGFLQWAQDNWAEIKPPEAGDDIVVGIVGWANAFGAGADTEEARAYADELGITVLPREEQEVSPTADVTGQLQNLLVNGANVIWIQSLSFGPAQVIGTLNALGAWDQVVVGSVNWGMNTDVINILGENAALAEGYYGVFPYLWWNDTDAPGVQMALDAFEAGGYDVASQDVGYLLSYGEMFALSQVLQQAINDVGFENLSGETFFNAMQEMGTVSAAGLYEFNVEGENRAPHMAQIRQAQVNDEGNVEFVVIEDFFELPDTRPPAP